MTPIDPTPHHSPSRLEAEALAEIRALIRIESVNSGEPSSIGDGETRAARYVQSRLEEAGYDTTFIEPVPGRGSVVARLPGTDPHAGALVVHAHLDVVPVEEAEWTHPPFAAEIHDGNLYGRGAVDMKNFAGTILAIARAFRTDGVRPRRELIFAFFADEEAGGVFGARWIVENRPELFAGATEAISEVGGFSVPLENGGRAYLVATAEKGVTSATITARGRAGHGSRPTADNALVRLAQAVTAIDAHPFPVERTTALSGFLTAFGQARGRAFGDDEDLEAELDHLPVLGPLIRSGLRGTASPTVLLAGSKTNVIPGRAHAKIDVRVLPGHVESFCEQLATVVGHGVEIEWHGLISPSESPLSTPLLDVLQRAITAEDADGTVVPFLLPASTDNKHLAQLGINGYGFVPLRVPDDFDVFAEFHSTDEHIPVESLHFCTRVMTRILREA